MAGALELPLKVLEGLPVVGIGLGKNGRKKVSWAAKEGNKSTRTLFFDGFFFCLYVFIWLGFFPVNKHQNPTQVLLS